MDSSTTHLVGVAIPTLRELRSAVLSAADADAAVTALREAGFAGGDAIHAAFEQWLTESQSVEARTSAADLPLDKFGDNAARFFRDAGWGEVVFSEDEADGVAIVDITNCWEGGSDSSGSAGCHVTTGLLASFFGKIAGYPVAVLETECCSGSGERCRFLMGNADVMNYKWAELAGTA
jgi:predicted hydrocarbon binding protein